MDVLFGGRTTARCVFLGFQISLDGGHFETIKKLKVLTGWRTNAALEAHGDITASFRAIDDHYVYTASLKNGHWCIGGGAVRLRDYYKRARAVLIDNKAVS